MKKKSFFVCGGDLRQIKLAEALADGGHDVCGYGFDKIVPCRFRVARSLEDGVQKADVVILPLPCLSDEEYINMPLSHVKIRGSDLIGRLTGNHAVFGGKIAESLQQLAEERGIHIVDYFEREELSVLNAIPIALSKEE